MKEYNTAQIAARLNLHDNTIRDWTRRYSDLLSDRANNPKRKYTEDDLSILATIAYYRDRGISFEAITDLLNEGTRIAPDDIPPPITQADEQARDNVELVTIPRDTLLVEQHELLYKIDTLTKELETTKHALQASTEDNETKQQRIIELERDLSSTKAQLTIIQQERKSSEYWMNRERKFSTYWFLALGLLLIGFFALVVFVIFNLSS